MKNKVDKEVIIGLAVLILLSLLAILLIVKREFLKDGSKRQARETVQVTEELNEDAVDEESDFVPEEESETVSEELLKENESGVSVPVNITKNAENRLDGMLPDEYYKTATMAEYKGKELWQLEELFNYWNDYQLDAVDDLIHLPRVRTFTKELDGSNQFYYYGDVNSNGKPDGNGLAVYASDSYYCGEWKNGKRSGQGMWLQIFPEKSGIVNGVTAVVDHSYNGEWSNDYPNGKGQEHISYDFEKMDPKQKADIFIANVIGNFKDGFYDGDLYIMTASENNEQVDWTARAKKGQYVYLGSDENTMKKRKVWEKTSHDDVDDEYYWMLPKKNKNQGIYSLKKK